MSSKTGTVSSRPGWDSKGWQRHGRAHTFSSANFTFLTSKAALSAAGPLSLDPVWMSPCGHMIKIQMFCCKTLFWGWITCKEKKRCRSLSEYYHHCSETKAPRLTHVSATHFPNLPIPRYTGWFLTALYDVPNIKFLSNWVTNWVTGDTLTATVKMNDPC